MKKGWMELMGSLVGTFAIAWMMMVGTGCSTLPGSGDGAAVPEVSGEVSHAIHGEQLAASMQELKRLSSLSSIAQMYSASELDLDLRETAEAAMQIQETARLIPDALGDIEISEEDRGRFLELVDTLEGKSGELAEFAKAGDLDGAKATAQALNQTCAECHGLYRVD
ncbi:MAG TPA: hypothetical protein DEW46_13235 [Verrucomicrobia bacterium]|jgi:soluble cytochrome b562|nr:hypothetical protein [Verrucomicrobiota bacterium]